MFYKVGCYGRWNLLEQRNLKLERHTMSARSEAEVGLSQLYKTELSDQGIHSLKLINIQPVGAFLPLIKDHNNNVSRNCAISMSGQTVNNCLPLGPRCVETTKTSLPDLKIHARIILISAVS
jgi:hypothetical protein